MIIKAKFVIQYESYLEYYELEELIDNIIENENKTLLYVSYWDLLCGYHIDNLEYGELIYIDSYYKENDEIYCNIYLDDDIDVYFNRKLDQDFRIDSEFDLIFELKNSTSNFCTLTNARELSNSIIQ